MNEMTFEQIDQHIQSHSRELENELSANEALDPTRICSIYHIIRPILMVLKNLPLIPSNWRKVISTFIDVMDQFCPSS